MTTKCLFFNPMIVQTYCSWICPPRICYPVYITHLSSSYCHYSSRKTVSFPFAFERQMWGFLALRNSIATRDCACAILGCARGVVTVRVRRLYRFRRWLGAYTRVGLILCRLRKPVRPWIRVYISEINGIPIWKKTYCNVLRSLGIDQPHEINPAPPEAFNPVAFTDVL